ncbi:bifunctional adenosylcobinamide kinase/adenosylcobinamide-phosphate guanylyltransferase [Tahibacter soli]|uniref:Bifunctional adenosylcobinamide kinase/adenosylcobinamide-phosphate guanylyltransferase n=1 Tax=Tahibacter soli TaxID=2983605 RepID=A0A9X4BHA7_9GAMM|nr:bifunctional adenosylcobinamide kinase/adenosylcobinamide-phosphate guanylyltransferase [Tahibacter soli]MDC8012596.1 bifunctional adenosylcobinamide kinase/adenosylcobinamide-phosphate guanylyltransferase [Tahibacter soli]
MSSEFRPSSDEREANKEATVARKSKIILVTGPRGCGKSELAETRLMARYRKPLYVGTLPLEHAFMPRIESHRRRRDSRWKLIEGLDDTPLAWDQLRISTFSADGILVDGLSSLLWCLTTTFGLKSSALRNYAELFFVCFLIRHVASSSLTATFRFLATKNTIGLIRSSARYTQTLRLRVSTG